MLSISMRSGCSLHQTPLREGSHVTQSPVQPSSVGCYPQLLFQRSCQGWFFCFGFVCLGFFVLFCLLFVWAFLFCSCFLGSFWLFFFFPWETKTLPPLKISRNSDLTYVSKWPYKDINLISHCSAHIVAFWLLELRLARKHGMWFRLQPQISFS